MILIITWFFLTSQAFEIIKLNEKNQILRNIIQINDESYSLQSYFTYGIWSKYNPLSIIEQNGLYGLLDSNLYQLHNAIDFEQQSLNLIYYDFIDYKQEFITKTIQFISNNNIEYKYGINIEKFEYENVWYFLQIYESPKLNKLELLIAKNDEIILRKQLQIEYPFSDDKMILTFGGSSKVVNSKIQEIGIGTIFSSFPGQIIVQQFSIEQISHNYDLSIFITETFQSINNCNCQMSEDSFKFINEDLKYLDKNSYISEYINCDSFNLIGWFKIIEIVSISQEFTYQIIKLSPNLNNSIYQNPNLAAFQLFYGISRNYNKIIITTYSYNFPAINIDYSNNPFLIQKEFIIDQNFVNQWHQLKLNLILNIFQFQIIIFQDGNNIEIVDKIEVIQFNNVQYKLQYGNMEQKNQNYLNLQIRNLMFNNCEKTINKQGCHFSCKECDGPSSSNCLSCYAQSQRVFLQKYKVCICPYNTIDRNEKCITEDDQKIRIIQQNSSNQIKNCLQGYFEFDQECYKCPSIINQDIISCFECYNNPKGWSSSPNCNTDIYLTTTIQNIEDTMHEFQSIYFYLDGIDLNFCSSCRIINKIDDEQGNYELSQQLFFGFLNFCQIEEYSIIYNECYICPINYCQNCQITLLGLQCIRCFDDYEFLDGICIQKIFINPYPKNQNIDECLPPYYISSQQQCLLCSIQNCEYCFEYLKQFPTENSFKPNLLFNFQEDLKVACALCKENYIFDFTLEKCLWQNPQIPNCLRSFIDQNSKEICTLSLIDFSISPEISDCLFYISNCQQCLKYHSKIICVICQTGYVVQSEQCVQNQELIQVSYQMQRWRMRVESFRLQFAPINQDFNNEIVIESENKCDPQCQICSSFKSCEFCNLNYFKQRMRVKRGQQCSDCPQLCQLCIDRTYQDIQLIQPLFEINDQNLIYTKQCLKPYVDQFINFYPYSKIAKYCIKQQCQYSAYVDIIISICDPRKYHKFRYEDYIDIHYFNQLAIDSIDLNSTFQIQGQFCQTPSFSILAKTTLKSKIFNLQKIQILLNSVETLFFNFQDLVQIIQYDSIIINNLGFIFNLKSIGKFEFINNNKKVDITLNKFNIKDSYINSVESVLNTMIFGNLNFTNISIINTQIQNSSFLNLHLYDFVGQITIDTITISNSIINNSQMFKFSKNQFNILIKNLVINHCELINSSFIYFTLNQINNTNLIFLNLNISDNIFTNSSFLYCSSQINLSIYNFLFINNTVLKSIILGFNYNLLLNNINIIENIFIDSQFLQTIQQLYEYQITCKLQYLEAKLNLFQNSNLFLLFSIYQMSGFIVEIQDIILDQNSKSSNSNSSNYLFNINCYKIIIKNAKIINSDSMHIFYLFENYKIIIQNVLYKQSKLKSKVQLSLDCVNQDKPINQLLQIQGFIDIFIQDVRVVNQVSYDETLIQISSSKQYINEINRKIIINRLEFFGNLLLSSIQIIRLSLITISSDQNLYVSLEDIKFKRNFMHIYQEDSLLYSAGLIYIISTQSEVKIKGLYCYENAYTNSSNSFIIITSDSVELNNIEVNYHNILPLNLWQEYYNISTDIEFNQDKVNYFISQVFQIKIIGGSFQISASHIHCINSKFNSIFALKSQIFDIITFGQGIVQLIYVTINQSHTDLISKSKKTGCININSQTSLLNLSIINVVFIKVQNRITSSILTIYPSLISNQILLDNVIIEDCFSLLNQIINAQFQQQIAHLNCITFKNIQIIQNLDAMINFFQQVKNLTSNEVLAITDINNAIILLENCISHINGLIFEGIFIGPLLLFINNPKLIFYNCQINNIQTIYSLNLISINQNNQEKQVVSFSQISIQRVSIFEKNLDQIIQEQNENYFIIGCILNKQGESRTEQHNYSKENIIKLQQSQPYQLNSILHIESQSNLNEFNFNFIQLQSNNCSTCSDGIAFFEISKFGKLTVEQLNCNYNIIQNFGCLNFESKLNIKSRIIIKNSNFINNLGREGVAIRVQKLPLVIEQVKIISNFANEKGGGLYVELNSSNYLIKNTIIMYNKAQAGGGIYLSGDNNLNKENIINTILIYNVGEVYGNNIVEQPTHLALQINDKEQPSVKLIQNNTELNLLNLQAYKTIEQNILRITKNLMIPSNQEIQNYTLFYLKGKQYITQIKQMYLYFKNSYNENLLDFRDSSCIVIDKVVSNTSNKKINLNGNQILLINQQKNSFDIGRLSFSLDPYNQMKSYLQIQLSCNSGLSNKTLKYIINSNSYKCQLGEFYVDDGCQICKSNQGFYSVIYDSIKCSIFDKQKFKNITSNMIQLLKGNWRPHYLSDYSEQCFKNLEFCIGGWGVGNELCKIGHIGGLCEECDIDNIIGNGQYFKNQWGLSCQQCFGIDNGIFSFILALFQALISITLSLRSIHKSNRLFASLKIGQKFSNIIFRLNQDHESILLKMWLNYLWIFSVIFTFNINFQFQFTLIDTTSNSFYFMAYNLDCYLSNQGIHLIYMRIFIILQLILIQLSIVIVASIIYTKFKKLKIDYSILSTTLLYLFIFNYGGLIKMLCSIVSNRKISNMNYIQGDVSLYFGTQNHIFWIIYLIVPGLFLFGCLIPFALLLLMHIKRHQFDLIKFRKHIAIFGNLLKLLQKLQLYQLLLIFETNILLKASLVGFSLLVYQILAGNTKPYNLSKFNILDLRTGQICSLSIFLATMKYVSEEINNQFLSVTLSIILIILCLQLSIPFIKDILQVYYQKFKSPCITFLLCLINQIKQNSMFSIYLNHLLQQWKLKENRVKFIYSKIRSNLLHQLRVQPESRRISQSQFNLIQNKTFQQSTFRCLIQLNQN